MTLDEPTAGMEVDVRRRFWGDVRAVVRRGTYFLFATHYVDEADQFADRVVMIAKGRVAADGTTAAVRAPTSGRAVSAAVSRPDAEAVVRKLPGIRISEIRGERAVFRSGQRTSSDEVLRYLLTRTDAGKVATVSLG
ncbi:hypothetical protein [Rhodococcus koreensis]